MAIFFFQKKKKQTTQQQQKNSQNSIVLLELSSDKKRDMNGRQCLNWGKKEMLYRYFFNVTNSSWRKYCECLDGENLRNENTYIRTEE